MAATAAIAGGLGISGLGTIYSGMNQSNAQNQNFQAVQQHQNLIQDYASRMMQPGMNPFAQSMLNFVGQGLSGGGAVNGFNPYGASNTGGGGGGAAGTATTPNSSNGTVTNPSEDPGQQVINPNVPMGQAPNYMMDNGSQVGNSGLAQYPNVPGYNGGWQSTYGGMFPGVDPMQQTPGATFSSLIASGQLSQDDVLKKLGVPADWANDPANAKDLQSLLGTNFSSSFTPNDSQGLQTAFSQAPRQTFQNGSVNAQGQYVPPGPAGSLQNGVYRGGSGNVLGYQGPNGMQASPYLNPQNGSTLPQNGGLNQGPQAYYGQGNSAGSYGGGGQMAPYNTINPFTYNPAQMGQAPLVNAPQAGIGSLFQGSQAQFSPGIQAQQVGVTGTQALNAGQDALMQMMNKNLAPAQDPSMSLNLQRLGSGADQYDTSSLFGAIKNQSNQNLNEQIAQLHGSAGSLGQRFGTAMAGQEGYLRSRATTDLNAQEQQLGMQAFQNAQQMRQPALDLQGQLLNQTNQVNQNNFGNQFQAASTLGGFGQQGAGLNLQASLANAQNSLTAQSQNQGLGGQLAQFNAGNQQQAGLAGQDLLSRLSQFNAGQGLQGQLANQGVLSQYGLTNANMLNQAGQFNANAGLQASQFNAQQGNTYNNLILQALSQANGMQLQQQGYNAGLLGIMNNVAVPQAQPSPWGQVTSNVGNLAMLAPFLMQMGGGGSRTPSYSGGGYQHAPG